VTEAEAVYLCLTGPKTLDALATVCTCIVSGGDAGMQHVRWKNTIDGGSEISGDGP
jgi:hypothetical protein